MATKSIPVEWIRDLNDTDKEEFEKILRNSTRLINKLREILEHKDAQIERTELSEISFDDPNWDYKQAFRNGQRSTIRDLKGLFNFIS